MSGTVTCATLPDFAAACCVVKADGSKEPLVVAPASAERLARLGRIPLVGRRATGISTIPGAPSDETAEHKLMDVVRAAGDGGILDVDIEEGGHEASVRLRPTIAALVIDGQIVAEEVDGFEHLRLRLAPPETPNLEARIVAFVAAAGLDGVDEDLLDEGLVDDLCEQMDLSWAPAMEPMFSGKIERLVRNLVGRDVIRDVGCGGGHYTLTPGEWARRIKAIVDAEGTDTTVDQIARLLAGTEA